MVEACLETVNTSPLLGGQHDLGEVLDAAATGGFGLVGLDTFSVAAWLAGGRTLAHLRSRLDNAGLRCWSVAPLRILDDHAESVSGARGIAEIVHVLDVSWVAVNCLVEASASATATFRECSAIVSAAGVRLAIEPVAWHPMDSIAKALDYVDSVGTAVAGVLPDPWHFFAARDSAANLRNVPPNAVAYLQFDDALPPVGTDLRNESVHRRAFPGEGQLDLASWCADVRSLGFDGVVSAEVLHEDWRAPEADQVRFARQALDSIIRFWGPVAGGPVLDPRLDTSATSSKGT